MLWYYRIGHPSFSHLKSLFPTLFNYKNVSLFQCKTCQLAKHHHSPYLAQPYTAFGAFSLIYCDIHMFQIQIIQNGSYLLLMIIHAFVGFTSWKKNLKLLKPLYNFITWLKLNFNPKSKSYELIMVLSILIPFLAIIHLLKGIVHHGSCTDTPQQNGVVKRKNQHLLEVAKSLMFTSLMPKKFWGEAILTTTFLINWMPSSVLNFNTPLSTLLPLTLLLVFTMPSYENLQLHCFSLMFQLIIVPNWILLPLNMSF